MNWVVLFAWLGVFSIGLTFLLGVILTGLGVYWLVSTTGMLGYWVVLGFFICLIGAVITLSVWVNIVLS